MDEHVLTSVVNEVGRKVSAAYDLQTVRDSNWTIIWGHAAGAPEYLHTFCDRCSFGVVFRTSGLLADRVTHSCPLLPGGEDATRLPNWRGPSPQNGGEVDWQVW